jgi:hypothetical protein
MKKTTFKKMVLIVMILLTVALIGCKTAPVYNISDAPVNASEKATSDDVKKAILAAGAGLGWQMKVLEPGHIEGRLFLRKHSAIIDIPYSSDSYSITYKDSTKLRYDGVNIHTNYNSWIQNLDRAIQARLSTL